MQSVFFLLSFGGKGVGGEEEFKRRRGGRGRGTFSFFFLLDKNKRVRRVDRALYESKE